MARYLRGKNTGATRGDPSDGTWGGGEGQKGVYLRDSELADGKLSPVNLRGVRFRPFGSALASKYRDVTFH